MNNGPIQQLVDAAKEERDFISLLDCEEGLTTEILIAQIDAAIKAVESAHVETRWEVVSKYTLPNVHSFFYESQAQRYYDSLWPSLEERHYPKRIVRLDTYRSVESDQK